MMQNNYYTPLTQETNFRGIKVQADQRMGPTHSIQLTAVKEGMYK